MFSTVPRFPRSIYPDFNNKKFDYSRDSNLHAYYEAAEKLGIKISPIGPEEIDSQTAEKVIDEIILTKTLHEMTARSEILWDAYNSYDNTLLLIRKKMDTCNQKDKEKLLLLLQYLRMHTGMNRRPIMDKHYSEIDDDAAYFKAIAEDAKRLIAEVTTK